MKRVPISGHHPEYDNSFRSKISYIPIIKDCLIKQVLAFATILLVFHVNALPVPEMGTPTVDLGIMTSSQADKPPYWETREGLHRLAYAIEQFSESHDQWPASLPESIEVPARIMMLDSETMYFLITDEKHVVMSRWSRLVYIKTSMQIILSLILATRVKHAYLDVVDYLRFRTYKTIFVSKLYGFTLWTTAIISEMLLCYSLSTGYAKVVEPKSLIRYIGDTQHQILRNAYKALYSFFLEKQLPGIIPSLRFQPKGEQECDSVIAQINPDHSSILCLPFLDNLVTMNQSDYSQWKEIQQWLEAESQEGSAVTE